MYLYSMIPIIVFSVLFPFLYAWQNSQHHKELLITETKRTDQAKKHSRNWHWIQSVIQALPCLLVYSVNFRFIVLYIALFWLIFDLTVNALAKRNLLYLGSNTIDKILSKLGPYHIIVKIALIGVGILIPILWK